MSASLACGESAAWLAESHLLLSFSVQRGGNCLLFPFKHTSVMAEGLYAAEE